MKVLCSALLLLFALHTVCMSQCLAAEHIVKPPCHDTSGDRDKNHDSNPCSEGSALDAKSSPLSKCMVQSVALLPSVLNPSTLQLEVGVRSAADSVPTLVSPSLPSAVLRI